MRIRSLHLYPVKSAAVLDVSEAAMEPWGLAGDRRWLAIDPTGGKADPLRHPRIFAVRPTLLDGGILLTADGHPDLFVATPADGPRIRIALSRQPDLRYAGPDAAAWLTEVVGTDLRLAWQEDPHARSVSASHGGEPGDALSLADTAPILLTTTASLDRLNGLVAEGPEPDPLPMIRFRPNVVVEGDLEPFVEDGWRSVRLGAVPLRFAEHCDRCAITTIDPVTLSRGKEPVRTLARHRKWDGKTWFGVRLLPVGSGTLHVGDEVEVVATAEPNPPNVSG
ncbi:MOSC domain-containing protein [Mumia zhuanghuii]|uniref:MOSC domain-containing protein n=2 Tax=Mumia TaxID=1546255 RepID=A0ABW1QHB4_9ACTN|nr:MULTISPECIES: MOSC N-terminal beta barrel domain-containing protein [Mumia]KAA1424621.1 MOSC domain-containing protein [Mumia zhuanghuii]